MPRGKYDEIYVNPPGHFANNEPLRGIRLPSEMTGPFLERLVRGYQRGNKGGRYFDEEEEEVEEEVIYGRDGDGVGRRGGRREVGEGGKSRVLYWERLGYNKGEMVDDRAKDGKTRGGRVDDHYGQEEVGYGEDVNGESRGGRRRYADPKREENVAYEGYQLQDDEKVREKSRRRKERRFRERFDDREEQRYAELRAQSKGRRRQSVGPSQEKAEHKRRPETGPSWKEAEYRQEQEAERYQEQQQARIRKWQEETYREQQEALHRQQQEELLQKQQEAEFRKKQEHADYEKLKARFQRLDIAKQQQKKNASYQPHAYLYTQPRESTSRRPAPPRKPAPQPQQERRKSQIRFAGPIVPHQPVPPARDQKFADLRRIDTRWERETLREFSRFNVQGHSETEEEVERGRRRTRN